MATSNEHHEAIVLKKLEKFKNARDWSDFLEPLDSLCSIFKNRKNGKIPCLPQLVKRLNQLLNQALPGGIHMKTIECYHAILDNIDQDELRKEFDALTIGVFNFSFHCRILVVNEYFGLVEKIINKLGENVESFAKNIVIGILPFLESESSEFYGRAYMMLVSFMNQISQKSFYTALWRNFIDFPELRISIINFMTSYKLIVVTDHSLVANALCAGLIGDNTYIVRSVLEMCTREYPFVVELTKKIEEPEEITDYATSEQYSYGQGRQVSDSEILITGCSSPVKQYSDYETAQSITSSPKRAIQNRRADTQSTLLKTNTLELQKVKSIVPENEITEENSSLCNTKLLQHALRIFLMKDVSINKRAYKWFNLGEQIAEKDVDYIERGLRSYLTGNEGDLLIFFRIINSLADKENVIGYLIERLIIDAMRQVMEMSEKQDIDCYVNIKKNVKLLLNHSLDDFYRVLYTNLAQSLVHYKEYVESSIGDRQDGLHLDVSSEFSDVSKEVQSLGTVEELVSIFIYSIEMFDAVNTNATTIHIPLLCHLLVRNRKKLPHALFKRFFDVFIEKAEESKNYETREVPEQLINVFYQKINCNELFELNLIGAVAKELSKLSVYNENPEDLMFWSDSNLVVQNGVLVWAQSSDAVSFVRHTGGFFNFYERDVEILQVFIEKFGYKDFDIDFLALTGKFLCFNYKYIELINKLSFYLNKDLLYVNMWNDFVITKNAKYFQFYPEVELLPVVHHVFPTVTLNDMCLFLQETLKYNKFIDVLFRMTTVIDTSSSQFIGLVMGLNDLLPLIDYIFARFFGENSDEHDFTAVAAILYILQVILDCDAFKEISQVNQMVYIERFGEISVIEAISKLLMSTITIELKHEQGYEKALRKYSAIVNLNGHIDVDMLRDINNRRDRLVCVNKESKERAEDTNEMCSNLTKLTIKEEEHTQTDEIKDAATNLQCAFDANINQKSQEVKEEPNIADEPEMIETTELKTLNTDQPVCDITMGSSFNLEKLQDEPDESTEKSSKKNTAVKERNASCFADSFINHPIVDFEIKIDDCFCLMAKNSLHLRKETSCKIAFDCLYKLYRKGIVVSVERIENMKRVIVENKHDFYILKRSLFIVQDDFEFIYSHYMHFYKLVLKEIADMPIKVAFFSFLSDLKTKCSVEIFLEAIPYLRSIASFKLDSLFYKAQALLTEKSKNSGVLYKKQNGKYKRLIQKTQATQEAEETGDLGQVPFTLKAVYTEDEIAEMLPAGMSLSSIVLVPTDDITSVLQLADLLYKLNASLFVSSIFHSIDTLYFLSLLPFKLEIIRKLIATHKQAKLPLRIITLFLTSIPFEQRNDLLKLEAENIRSCFGTGEQDQEAQEFVIELFRRQPPSDLSKVVILHLLNQYETRIDQVLKSNATFDVECKHLKMLVKTTMKDVSVITAYRNCLFSLLASKTYRERALLIIYLYFRKNPNCKIFIDQYVQYFNKNFFTFGLLLKKQIFSVISTSSLFDPFVVIETAFSGMDTSFFMSAQSEELLKISSIRKMGFLLLSQPNNKFSVMADNFVCLINNLINSTPDIKYELVRFCSILILKIDHNYLQTLYPIMIAEVMASVRSKDTRLLSEILKFVDLSIWLNSAVFDFKTLFLDEHNFRHELTTKIFVAEYEQVTFDSGTVKLPNMIYSVFTKFSDWSDFSLLIHMMPQYYRNKESNMIGNDYKAVETAMINSFSDHNK